MITGYQKKMESDADAACLPQRRRVCHDKMIYDKLIWLFVYDELILMESIERLSP